VISTFLLQLLHETGMPDLYPFIGLIILHVIISGSSLILHKVFDKQEKITTDATKIDGVMKEEDIAIKVDILGMYAILCLPLFIALPFFLFIVLSSYCKSVE
jgi:hypothetical protein